MSSRFSRPLRRIVAAGAAGAAALAGAAFPVSPAGAETVPVPMSPGEAGVRDSWVAPNSRPGEGDSPVEFELVDAPTLNTGSLNLGGNLTVRLRLTNTSGQPVDALSVTPQRKEAAADVSGAREALAGPSVAFGYYGQSTQVAGLDPGETREVTVTVETQPDAESTLSITEPGVYPVLVSLLGTDPDSAQNRLFATQRFLLPVVDPAGDAAGDASDEEEPAGLSMILPLAADVDITPGETGEAPNTQPLVLSSEKLAEDIAPGGRLTRLLDAHADAAHTDSVCVAVDPELLDVVDRMSRGYTVSPTRPQPERPERLRDSWGQDSDGTPGEPGRGEEDAQAFVDKLSEIAATSCIVSLPWANAELDAVAATNDPWLMRESLERGPVTLNRILGTPGEINTVLAPAGYVSPATARQLGWADHAGSELATAGMSSAWEKATAAAGAAGTDPLSAPNPPEPSRPVRVAVADNTVFADSGAGRFAPLADSVTGVGYHAALAATFAATGDHPVTAGYSNPQSRYDLRLDSPLGRDISASAALRLAAGESDPVLAVLPAAVDADAAARALRTADDLIDSGAAEPLPLGDYLTPGGADAERLAEAPVLADVESPAFGAPFTDPGVYSDPEITAAAQQARYTDDLTRILSNDAALALTRYGYTLPVRRDQIRALSATGRHAVSLFDDRVERSAAILRDNGAALQQLREAIVLLPPGNVYTRTSEASPLLIVAENRLPLPVEATIDYAADDPAARLSTPRSIRIPAYGSITVQMTADLPAESERNELQLWLATNDGTQISAPVEITVQTRGGTLALLTAFAVLGLGLAAALGLRLIRSGGRWRTQRRASSRRPSGRPPRRRPPQPPPRPPDSG